jgi:hypothetical protein
MPERNPTFEKRGKFHAGWRDKKGSRKHNPNGRSNP